jgi:hypothetical protein
MMHQSFVLFFLGLAFALLAGCDSGPTAPCTDSGPLAGLWTYAAVESGPSGFRRDGTMEIEGSACPDLRGTFDVVEVGPTGARDRASGPIYGTTDSEGARLNLILGATRLEHSTVFDSDTLRGDWIAVREGDIVASGTFHATRKAQ